MNTIQAMAKPIAAGTNTIRPNPTVTSVTMTATIPATKPPINQVSWKFSASRACSAMNRSSSFLMR